MKITFLKDHLYHRKGEQLDVTEERARYWELCGVAESATGENADKAGPSEKKVIQPKKEKADKAGPKK